ncbi:unnamed protein product [Phytophthora fragariaefolia]|uniref:Unnamed protein product n=1 Tax=Phytophthora fragariaefolia TaxID=1490495 RepID=A0A9W6XLC8_9STRA|nr:unnamed protein product [Phytophthora fragariaefolia]
MYNIHPCQNHGTFVTTANQAPGSCTWIRRSPSVGSKRTLVDAIHQSTSSLACPGRRTAKRLRRQHPTSKTAARVNNCERHYIRNRGDLYHLHGYASNPVGTSSALHSHRHHSVHDIDEVPGTGLRHEIPQLVTSV